MHLEMIFKHTLSSLFAYRTLLTKNHITRRNGNKWIFISYITEPLKQRGNDFYFRGHQNRQETLIIEEVVQELGFSCIFNDYDKPLNFKNRNFDIVFGLEPNFEKICNLNQNAIKIYYATGAYYKHQNLMIINSTRDFEERHHVKYPLRRMVKEHSSCETADYIFQIGSEFTVETYPENLRHKILLINQTSHTFKNIDIDQKIKTTSKNDFIWFGSTGTILKGLSVVVEYFLQNQNFNLHIVGPVETEFLSVFKESIDKVNNIYIYGYLDVESAIFRNLANKCAFLIFPSGSEGGPPGSVINLQKLGVIPLTSRWASCSGIANLGYLLEDLSTSSINNAIDWSQSLTYEDIVKLIKENHDYVVKTHNNHKFKSELKKNLSSIISYHNIRMV